MTSQPEEHSCKVTHNIENVMCHCRERNDILLAPEVAEVYISVLPRLLLQGAAPCPLFVTPCPFEKAEMTPCPALLTNFFFFFFKYQSHMAFSSVLPFLLPTRSVDCAVHLLLSHSRALLVSSPLFHPFTALIMPFFFSSPR